MHAELSFLTDLGLIFSAAVILALLLMRKGLPAVLAYLGTGFVLGPSGLGLVERTESVEILAELGVILLLFTIGLEFSLAEMRRSWRAVLLGGGLQVGITIAVTAVVALLLGKAMPVALAWGFLIALSSTAVVLRLLDVRGETKAPHGRLVVGILIFQDLCIVPLMLMLPVLAGDSTHGSPLGMLVQGALVVGGVLLGARYVVPWAMKLVAHSRNREVFLLAVLAIGGITAVLTSLTGLSLSLGAFLAGMMLAETQYSHQALADVLPLRAVMMCVFFVAIGMLVDVTVVMEHPFAVMGLFLAILNGKALLVLLVSVILRFPVRIAGVAAVALAQVGEFSLVLAAAAEQHGLLTPTEEQIFLVAAVMSIVVSPLLFMLSPRILAGSRLLEPLEELLDGRALSPDRGDEQQLHDHVIVAGLGVGGRTVVAAFEAVGITPVIVEMNPETVQKERERGRHVVFGDITSAEVLEHAGVEHARAVVLVVSDPQAASNARRVIHDHYPELPIIMRTRYALDEAEERSAVTEVLSEEFSGAVALAGLALRRCGVNQWARVIAHLVAEHEQLGPQDEGELGPPPRQLAAELLSSPGQRSDQR